MSPTPRGAKWSNYIKILQEDIYSVLSTKNVEVYRAAGIILINNLHDEDLARSIESQIFFRDLSPNYTLNIHRIVWEDNQIKERGASKAQR